MTVIHYKYEDIGRNRWEVDMAIQTFKQDCKRCNNTGVPDHFDEETERIAKKFAERLFKCFRLVDNEGNYAGLGSKGDGEHDKNRCHACKAGICTLGERPAMFNKPSFGGRR